jgi:hypothetical protein
MEARWSNPQENPPQVCIMRDRNAPLMSVLIYDLDAPYPYDRHQSPYLHYVRTNVACCREAAVTLQKLGEGHKVDAVLYEPPTPHKHIPHCYQVEVVGHSHPIDTTELVHTVTTNGRASFALNKLREKYGLYTIDKKFFMSSGKNKACLANGKSPQS